jgi:NhaP-type Na+/H+ or K+/H+ antiporter
MTSFIIGLCIGFIVGYALGLFIDKLDKKVKNARG